ncbi:hypothetical protein D3C72_338470 [compost metagenome]
MITDREPTVEGSTPVASSFSWQCLQLKDLLYAYRKAKADCFYERSSIASSIFASYEINLLSNLKDLLSRLHLQEGNVIIDSIKMPGDRALALSVHLPSGQLIGKKMSLKPGNEASSREQVFYSNPEREYSRLLNSKELDPEFRIVGNFSVDMHILSALWINLVGHKFDEQLCPKNVYGNRLRRFRAPFGSPLDAVGNFHMDAIGSFPPYFERYKAWRDDGLAAIRREIEAGHSVVAVTMDLANYYHNLDPGLLADDVFLGEMGLLEGWEREFTKAFADAFLWWGKQARQEFLRLGGKAEDCPTSKTMGMPIGLSMVRIVCNAFLESLDRDIEHGLRPVFYGRYVDDMFLVIRDVSKFPPMTESATKSLLSFIGQRTNSFPNKVNSEEVKLRILCGSKNAKWKKQSRIFLKISKLKIFHLEAEGGLDLLNNIAAQLRNVASERRLMPSLGCLEDGVAAQVLASSGITEDADSLRRADAMTLRRLAWSVRLSQIESLGRDLPPILWNKERKAFYTFACNHVLRADRLLDHLDYLPRLLSFAVSLGDWRDANRLYDTSQKAIDRLMFVKTGKINGMEIGAPVATGQTHWGHLKEWVRVVSREATLIALPWNKERGHFDKLSPDAIKLLVNLEPTWTIDDWQLRGGQLRMADLAKTRYSHHLMWECGSEREATEDEKLDPNYYTFYNYHQELLKFLDMADTAIKQNAYRMGAQRRTNKPAQNRSLLPYIFPTRPTTPQEIASILPDDCIFGEPSVTINNWRRLVQGARGVWVRTKRNNAIEVDGWKTKTVPAIGSESETKLQLAELGRSSENKHQIAEIGLQKTKEIRLGITCLLTEDESFNAQAFGKPKLAKERYERLADLVNQAIQCNERPTHLLLHELALPQAWVNTVVKKLQDAGINLIAGLEYSHVNSTNNISSLADPAKTNSGLNGRVFSEALLALSDDRLGYRSCVLIRQPKSYPAVGERHDLRNRFGREWEGSLGSSHKPVYIHEGFHFGVLICSELQNIHYRTHFQGKIDCLIVLSWNKDLETFSALIESAALDVHAKIAVVNNSKYGDSRVRVPAKAAHKRDRCRLRGGKNPYLAVVPIEFGKLRAYQSQVDPPPQETDPYKPVPEGFNLAETRRTVPGGAD